MATPPCKHAGPSSSAAGDKQAAAQPGDCGRRLRVSCRLAFRALCPATCPAHPSEPSLSLGYPGWLMPVASPGGSPLPMCILQGGCFSSLRLCKAGALKLIACQDSIARGIGDRSRERGRGRGRGRGSSTTTTTDSSGSSSSSSSRGRGSSSRPAPARQQPGAARVSVC